MTAGSRDNDIDHVVTCYILFKIDDQYHASALGMSSFYTLLKPIFMAAAGNTDNYISSVLPTSLSSYAQLAIYSSNTVFNFNERNDNT